MSGVQKIKIEDKDEEQRLDKWFQRAFPGIPLSHLNKILRKGEMRVNGKRIKNSHRLSVGDEIRVPPLQPGVVREKNTPRELSANDIKRAKSWVIYEDDHVIALNKPFGLAVQGGTGTEDHIDLYLNALTPSREEKPKLVHRLDKHTSGVLLLAKDRKTAKHLMQEFQRNRVEKSYWALVIGQPSPKEGQIESMLSKQPTKHGEKIMEDPDNGRVAITDYRVVESANREYSWVEMRPQTGRMHQLRVHMQQLETPIFGDGKYGGANKMIPDLSKNLHLCAMSLRFTRPDGKSVLVKADLPQHMQNTWEYFGFDLRSAL